MGFSSCLLHNRHVKCLNSLGSFYSPKPPEHTCEKRATLMQSLTKRILSLQDERKVAATKLT